MRSAEVICRLPQAGLGNQLFPLMHAGLFAELNQLPLRVVGIHQFKPGPYLRGEKVKRQYRGYFNLERPWLSSLWPSVQTWYRLRRGPVIAEPELLRLYDIPSGQVFLFEQLPHYRDYFIHLKPFRQQVIRLFYSLLTPHIRNLADKTACPEVGVHIRMGDFRALRAGEEFKGGHVRTPLTYFSDIIQQLRARAGRPLSVTLFSDGYAHELQPLLELGNVSLAQGDPDIVDLIRLSKSRILVTSTGSTFSYWAAFLSSAPVILHPDHIHARLRDPEEGLSLFEGPADRFIQQWDTFFHE